VAEFKPAIEVVLGHEGGFQKRASDPGNWTGGKCGEGELKGTKFGISAASFPQIDIESLTISEAEAIYERDWWRFSEINDQAVANKIMDLAVNWQRFGGHGPAIEVLQKAVVSRGIPIAVDGCLGQQTIIACNNLDPIPLLREIRQQALLRYKEIERNNPQEAEWFHGWEERALS
jgi:lysozyme family protein